MHEMYSILNTFGIIGYTTSTISGQLVGFTLMNPQFAIAALVSSLLMKVGAD
jgi:hypothetical protein